MTSVTFFQEEGRPVGFRAAGHAGFAAAGEDIVCAAVSALCQTAVLGLCRVVRVPAEQRVDEDRALLEFLITERCDPEIERGAQVILRTLEEGITDISTQYPDCVRVIHRERRQKP